MAGSTAADVVIVGSGVAGSLVAYRLAKAGASVILLEAGPRLPRWQIVENFRRAPEKRDLSAPYPLPRHAPRPEPMNPGSYLVNRGAKAYEPQYLRLVGGTTWHWAGAAWRLLPADFRLHTLHGVGRDWPFPYETLEPWYGQAENELGVAGPVVDLGSPRSTPYPMPPLPLSYLDQRFAQVLAAQSLRAVPEPMARNSRAYDGRPPCCGANSCMPVCPIGALYHGATHADKAERAGAKLIAQAVAYRIEANDKGEIVAIHYKDPNGVSTRVTGRRFVIAANGIETPKLLLMSASARFAKGIANASDQVGRNLMDHPGVAVSFLANEALWPGRGPVEMSSVVDFRDGPFRAQQAAKKLHLSNASPTLVVTSNLIEAGLSGGELDRQIREQSARRLTLGSFHEQLASPDNRVSLSAEKDVLGLPRPEIRYAIDDYVRRSAADTRALFDQIAGWFGGEQIEHDDGLEPSSHIMGTAIMGRDASDSVVDADCRAHDHPNLFVAGSAVMPAGGSVNCTLTIAALALRLAGTIEASLR
ncbi:GMC family oxidoreductase [Caballeronia sp. LZ062]|uniref:GMC family oxidoreductase n=1 Tax=unclassified Caballeronia TaxID=2646786 RepID=UPI002863F131|nr:MULTISPECIES: GMC family oxidoreductase [unclassified Caballeronia]MDR5856937.1 GMC family oxidoreductase [Caballeronia sp. LZ050]MDR5869666.1 GMC family oxidoreductase [Caballeronia sp. LZ062]